MIENTTVGTAKALVGTPPDGATTKQEASPARPAWVSNVRDSEAVVSDADKQATREANTWGLRQLFAGKDVAEICNGLSRELAKDSLWERIKRSFSSKAAAVPVADEIALYPPDLRYAGYEGYVGFAYIREAASYSTLVRIPEEMLEDPGLLARVKAGVTRVAEELRRTGKLEVHRDYRASVAT